MGFKTREGLELNEKRATNMKSEKGKHDLKKCHEGTARVREGIRQYVHQKGVPADEVEVHSMRQWQAMHQCVWTLVVQEYITIYSSSTAGTVWLMHHAGCKRQQ